MKTTIKSARLVAAVTLTALALGGCATVKNEKDPFEKFNRAMFTFNDGLDRVALKPAATAYKRVLPSFVQTGVNNFFSNLTDAWSAVNNLLQGKGEAGMSDVTRFALNSTFGLGGVLDIASQAGLQKHNEDLGQTLGSWGVPSGPYLMLPILGPSTVRDTAALPADLWADPWNHKEPIRWRNVGTGVRAIDQRASVLDASNLMEDAALDRYEFIRDGFLQRRESRINDGGDSTKAKKNSVNVPAAMASPDGGKLDMKAAYGSDAPAAAPAADAAAPSGKVDMKAAYGDDAADAADSTSKPVPTTPATPPAVRK